MVNPSGGLEVRAPYHFTLAAARAALCSNRRWVVAEVAAAVLRRPPALRPGVRLPYLGDELELRLVCSPRFRVRHAPGTIWVDGPSGDDASLRRRIEHWYRKEAKTHFTQRIAMLAPRFSLRRPSRLSVRGQRTRWGSCSAQGAVSLNWRLLMLDRDLVDYVVAHELCHLEHMDHSPAFWALLGQGMPDYERRRTGLVGSGIHLPL